MIATSFVFVFTMLSLLYKMDVLKVSYTHIDWDLDTYATTSIRLFRKCSSSFLKKMAKHYWKSSPHYRKPSGRFQLDFSLRN